MLVHVIVRTEGWTCHMPNGGVPYKAVTCTLRGGPYNNKPKLKYILSNYFLYFGNFGILCIELYGIVGFQRLYKLTLQHDAGMGWDFWLKFLALLINVEVELLGGMHSYLVGFPKMDLRMTRNMFGLCYQMNRQWPLLYCEFSDLWSRLYEPALEVVLSFNYENWHVAFHIIFLTRGINMSCKPFCEKIFKR